MPNTTVIFVRHAQSLHPFSDDRTRPLTEEGLKDRMIVLDILKDRHIDAFLCSPFKRSLDTILPVAEYFKMEIKTDDRFRERKAGYDSFAYREKRWEDFYGFNRDGRWPVAYALMVAGTAVICVVFYVVLNLP